MNLLFQHENPAFQKLQVLHCLTQSEAVMIVQASLQSQPQLWNLASQAALGHLRQHHRITLPVDDGFQHRSAGTSQYIAGHGSQFDIGVLQNGLNPVGHGCVFLH
jgi:hypothetical protein